MFKGKRPLTLSHKDHDGALAAQVVSDMDLGGSDFGVDFVTMGAAAAGAGAGNYLGKKSTLAAMIGGALGALAPVVFGWETDDVSFGGDRHWEGNYHFGSEMTEAIFDEDPDPYSLGG